MKEGARTMIDEEDIIREAAERCGITVDQVRRLFEVYKRHRQAWEDELAKRRKRRSTPDDLKNEFEQLDAAVLRLCRQLARRIRDVEAIPYTPPPGPPTKH
jgi:hypothetical protein